MALKIPNYESHIILCTYLPITVYHCIHIFIVCTCIVYTLYCIYIIYVIEIHLDSSEISIRVEQKDGTVTDKKFQKDPKQSKHAHNALILLCMYFSMYFDIIGVYISIHSDQGVLKLMSICNSTAIYVKDGRKQTFKGR